MSNVKFIGCLHIGHKTMAIKHRGFENVFQHDEYLIEQWNKTVHKKDLTYILGDVTMETAEHYCQLDRLNGRKIVVLGNHDLIRDTKELLKYVENVAGMVDYKGYCLTHAPIHPSEIHFYRANIHAHIHENELVECITPDKYKDRDSVLQTTLHKYINVDAKLIDFIPRSLKELLNQNNI